MKMLGFAWNYFDEMIIANVGILSEKEARFLFLAKFAQHQTVYFMRLLIQRVTRASVSIGGSEHAAVGPGLLVFVGIEEADGPEDAEWLCAKLMKLRIFDDEAGVMNRSAEEVGADVLIVSQFTLHASTRKGNRPSYIRAARPETAVPLYEAFIDAVRGAASGKVASGVFGADMQVELLNDGPVTIWIDSKAKE